VHNEHLVALGIGDHRLNSRSMFLNSRSSD
jgi:hypothetical protein